MNCQAVKSEQVIKAWRS